MAEALGYHTSNKPLLGYVRRHLDEPGFRLELNMALVHHAGKGNEKGVALCLWAGADPHATARSLDHPGLTDSEDDDTIADEDRFLGWTAIEEAVSTGHVNILERLGPDPARDDFDDLYELAGSSSVIELLGRRALPKNVGRVVNRQISFCWWRSDERWQYLSRLRSLFSVGAKWEASKPDEIASVRRSLLKLPDDMFREAIELLAKADYCSETILRELIRTPSMRDRVKKAGLIPGPVNDSNRHPYRQVTPLSRKTLARLGIFLPKPEPYVPGWVEVRKWRRDQEEVHLTRPELFERVWTEPVSKLAKVWGLSDRGLGKLCGRLKIPVPPRGYWARLEHGQKPRRPDLPDLKPGHLLMLGFKLSRVALYAASEPAIREILAEFWLPDRRRFPEPRSVALCV
jgi:hypothetical protein